MTLRDRPDLDHQLQNRRKIAEKAEAAGWTVTGNSPVQLTKGDRTIVITFNKGGMPNGAQWLGGDEFTGMDASGYMNLNTVFNDWLIWEEKSEKDEAAEEN